MNPAELRYSRMHEWVAVDGPVAVIGLTDVAIKLLEDPVSLSLPQLGQLVSPGDPIGEIESSKTVNDIYSPLSGQIIEVNSALPDDLDLLNLSPFDRAWIARIRMANPTEAAQLMSHSDYLRFCKQDAPPR
jgi:glycine cleavage system H protein